MNFLRLVLVVSLSFGIGVNSTISEVMVESEIPEAKEILYPNYLITRGLKFSKFSVSELDKTSSNSLFHTSTNIPLTKPHSSIKRHIWVMQFLL